MKRFHIPVLVAVVALFFLSSTDMFAKKPVFKNTSWVCEQQMFIADVGTATDTYTLEFTSAKECVMNFLSIIPAYSAMYVNEDGTIDRFPERRRESTNKGTYTYRKGKLEIQFEDGTSETYRYEDGCLKGFNPMGELVFEKS